MMRNVVLGVSSLAVLLVLFLTYTLIVREPAASSRNAELALEGVPPAKPLQASEVLTIGTDNPISLPKGDAAGITIYDEKTGQPTRRFTYAEWKPVDTGTNDDQVWVRKPQLIQRNPNGMIATITADEGQVALERLEKTSGGWKYGWLSGNAKIVIDRNSDPDRAPESQRPEDLITITMDRIDFDLDLGKVKTEGPILARSTEFEISGTGLDMTWNQAANRVEELTIKAGRELVLYKAADFLGANGASNPTPPTSAPSNETNTGNPQVPATPQAADAAIAADDGPSGAAGASPVRSRPKRPSHRTTYLCTLSGPVTAERFADGAANSSLSCGGLNLIFEMGGGAGALGEKKATPAEPQNNKLVVHWTGPLSLTPTTLPDRTTRVPGSRSKPDADQPSNGEAAPKSGPPRRRLEALGPVVTLNLRNAAGDDSSLQCGHMEYHDDTGQIWLSRGENDRVSMAVGGGRTATASSIYIDRGKNVIKLVGEVLLESQSGSTGVAGAKANEKSPAGAAPASGEMIASKPQTSIRCSQLAELTLYPSSSGDRAALGANLDDFGGEIRTAVFWGDVRVRMREQLLSANQLDLAFRKRVGKESFDDLLTSAVALGAVSLASENDDIHCGRLQLAFANTADGKGYLAGFDGSGSVLVTRGKPAFDAADAAAKAFTSMGEAGAAYFKIGFPYAVLTAARSARVFDRSDSGPARLSGNQIVGTLNPPEPASKGATDAATKKQDSGQGLALRTLEISGRAELKDPESKTHVRGAHISAWFKKGALDKDELDRAQVTSAAGEMALVHANPYTVRGEKIDMSAENLTLHVDGPSRLTFFSQRGLQGQQRSEPSKVTVTGRDLLHIDGNGNKVRIEGDVVAASGDEKLKCSKLTLLLEEAKKPAVSRDRPESNATEASIAAIFGGAGRKDAAKNERGGRFAGIGRTTASRKEPVRLIAEDALALTEEYEPGQDQPIVHTSLEAPRLEVEIPQRRMETSGYTTLLMTDYRVEPEPGGPRSASIVPSDLMSGGPSQTVIVCHKSMTYVLGEPGPDRRDSVLMEENVKLFHRAGKDVSNIEQTPAGRLQKSAVGKLKGRNTNLTADRLECQFGRVTPIGGSARGQNARPAAKSTAGSNSRNGQPGSQPRPSQTGPGSRLAWLLATGRVQLQDKQENMNNEIFADRLSFDRAVGLVSIFGSREAEARIYRWDEKKGKFSTPAVGPAFQLDVLNNKLRTGAARGEIQP